jgi:tRNA/rRNA methyltransferase
VLTPAELDRVHIVLVKSRNPLNIGAAARAISNFGFLHLRVVHPYAVAFQQAKSAVNAELVLAASEQFEQLPEAVADCSLVVGTTGGARRDPQEPLHPLEAAAEIIRTRLRSGSRVALLFGSEKVGLSNQDLSHCQLLLRIPTRTEHPSMNLGQAVAIVLYELVSNEPVSHQPAPQPEEEAPSSAAPDPATAHPLATAGERERLIALLLEALSINGYPHRRNAALMEEKVRRLVRHLALTSPDLHQWLGLLRQLLWKLHTQKSPPPQD